MAAQNAVQLLGTNAVPVLLEMIAYEDSPWKRWLGRALPKQSLVRVKLLSEDSIRVSAIYGFHALGHQATSAIPNLEKLMVHSLNNDAGIALGAIGPFADISLRRAISNDNFHVRWAAIDGLELAYCSNCQVCTFGLAEKRDDSEIQSLVATINHVAKTDPNERVRFRAIRALGHICRADTIIPWLASAAKDPSDLVRCEALVRLGEFAKDSAALDAIRNAVGDESPRVRETALKLLAKAETW